MTTINELLPNKVKTKSERVPVPSLGKGAEIIVREMTIKDAVRHDAIVNTHAEKGVVNTEIAVIAKLVATMVNEDGDYIAKPEDVVELSQKLGKKTVNDLISAFSRVNTGDNEINDKTLEEKKSKS